MEVVYLRFAIVVAEPEGVLLLRNLGRHEHGFDAGYWRKRQVLAAVHRAEIDRRDAVGRRIVRGIAEGGTLRRHVAANARAPARDLAATVDRHGRARRRVEPEGGVLRDELLRLALFGFGGKPLLLKVLRHGGALFVGKRAREDDEFGKHLAASAIVRAVAADGVRGRAAFLHLGGGDHETDRRILACHAGDLVRPAPELAEPLLAIA